MLVRTHVKSGTMSGLAEGIYFPGQMQVPYWIDTPDDCSGQCDKHNNCV
jgi:hypothetical protein